MKKIFTINKAPKNDEELIRLIQVLVKPQFKITEIDIIYNDLKNWERANLLYTKLVTKDKSQYKLSYLEYSWIKIIQTLKTYGYTYEEIREIRGEMFIPNACTREIQLFFDSIEDEDFRIKYSIIKTDFLNSFSLNNSSIIHISNLLMMLLSSLLLDVKLNLIFRKESPKDFIQLDNTLFNKISTNKELRDYSNKILNKTHLNISITEILNVFVNDNIGTNEFTSIITKEERKILSNIRNYSGKISLVKVIYKNGNAEILEIEGEIKKVDIENRLIDIIKKGDYGSIDIKFQNGKINNFKKTEKIKL